MGAEGAVWEKRLLFCVRGGGGVLAGEVVGGAGSGLAFLRALGHLFPRYLFSAPVLRALFEAQWVER